MWFFKYTHFYARIGIITVLWLCRGYKNCYHPNFSAGYIYVALRVVLVTYKLRNVFVHILDMKYIRQC